jgi:hypothetical protein
LDLRKIGGIIVFLGIVLIVIFIVEIGVVPVEIVGGIIIGFLTAQIVPAWKYFFGNNKEKTTRNIPMPWEKAEFKAEIVNKKEYYIRGQDVVIFRSKYKGKLKNGYFVNEIFVPEVIAEPSQQYKYFFRPTTPNVGKDFKSVKSDCLETIDNSSNGMGNLNGNKYYDWKEWEWVIPSDVPLGTYTVKMMVFDGGKDNLPLETREDKFEVLRPSSENTLNIWDNVNAENI